jgi:hypothetical protein
MALSECVLPREIVIEIAIRDSEVFDVIMKTCGLFRDELKKLDKYTLFAKCEFDEGGDVIVVTYRHKKTNRIIHLYHFLLVAKVVLVHRKTNAYWNLRIEYPGNNSDVESGTRMVVVFTQPWINKDLSYITTVEEITPQRRMLSLIERHRARALCGGVVKADRLSYCRPPVDLNTLP